MFEQDAEEYVIKKHNIDIAKQAVDFSLRCEFADDFTDFQKGAEFGYNKCLEEATQKYNAIIADYDNRIADLNKANEWHYVKDGDLPKETKEYLVYKIDGYGCKSIQVRQFNNQHCWCANCQKEIKAWKEIVLPEQKE